jgi:hypothetical protein
MPNYIFFNGSIKCVGYQASSNSQEIRFSWTITQQFYTIDSRFCRYSEKSDVFGPQINKNCCNDTKQSFLCEDNSRCISKHRLRDSINDCHDGTDEDIYQDYYIKKRHRLKCSKNVPSYLLLSEIGDGVVNCHGATDEYITQLKWDLFDHQCRIANSMESNILRTYIQSPSSLLTMNNSKVILFCQYCDTLWHLPRGFDESFCKEWKCPKDQYQCLTGHCIPLDKIIKHSFEEWNCPDASDNIRLLEIPQLSEHNLKLIRHLDFETIKVKLIEYNSDYNFVPFTSYCNESNEYGCILANVNDSLNFTINRPCINLTQIGDGTIDCYGGLDERNLLTCGNNLYDQRGFDFHCSDQECIPYHLHCEQRCSNKADKLVCDEFPKLWYSTCPGLPHKDICAFPNLLVCHLYKIVIYYCDSYRRGKCHKE